MPWDVLLLVLIGAALHASWNVIVKAGLHRMLDTIVVVMGAGAITTVAALLLPLPAPECYPYLAASVTIHLLYFVLVALAYQSGDLSLVYPLTRGSAPALTTIAAIPLLAERPSAIAWAGIALISLGAFILIGDSRRSGRSQRNSILLALANAIVIVVYTLVDGMGAAASGQPFSYTAWMLALTALFMIVGTTAIGRKRAIVHLASRWHVGILGGACLFLAYGLALWAMTLAPIALVGALRETSIVFGVVLAGWVLKEQITRLRCLSILAIGAGAVCLKIG